MRRRHIPKSGSTKKHSEPLEKLAEGEELFALYIGTGYFQSNIFSLLLHRLDVFNMDSTFFKQMSFLCGTFRPSSDELHAVER